MSTTATEAQGARPIRTVLSGDAAVKWLKKRAVEETRSPLPGACTDSAEIPRVAAPRVAARHPRAAWCQAACSISLMVAGLRWAHAVSSL